MSSPEEARTLRSIEEMLTLSSPILLRFLASRSTSELYLSLSIPRVSTDSPLPTFQILYTGYTDEITKGLLTSPALKARITLLAKRKVDAMVLEPGEDRAKVQKRVERGLEGVARRMSASLIAKVESPRLIRVYGIVLQNLFARLYNWGVQ